MSRDSDSDGDFQPKSRPLSTLALSFAASLDNAFELSPEIDSLSRSIANKRRSVTIQKSELESIQAKIRETEDRLRQQQSGMVTTPPARQVSTSPKAAKKTPLEAISSSGSEDESDSTDSDTEEDGTPTKDSLSEEDEEEEEEDKVKGETRVPEQKPRSPPGRQRAISHAPPPMKGPKSQHQPLQKRPNTVHGDKKRLNSRGKA